jgi:DNA-binding beta-propeller fold protein YncE
MKLALKHIEITNYKYFMKAIRKANNFLKPKDNKGMLNVIHLFAICVCAIDLGTPPSSASVPSGAAVECALKLNVLSRFHTSWWNMSGAEIPAYDPVNKRLWFTNNAEGLECISIADPIKPEQFKTIRQFGLNSVAVGENVIAIASQPRSKDVRGSVSFFNLEGNKISKVEVGFNPDMIKFTHDGKRLLVVNEGEAPTDGHSDPVGSIGVVDISGGADKPIVRDCGFDAFEIQKAELVKRGMHMVTPNAGFSQEIEPEYMALSNDDTKAYATLQENNAIAVIDLAPGHERVERIEPLGFKNFMKPGCGLDASDKDGANHIQNLPVFGLYQPDGVACFENGGARYLVTANEGEDRERDDFTEAVQFGKLKNVQGKGKSNGKGKVSTIDEESFAKQLGADNTMRVQDLSKPENMGRLKVSSLRGDDDGDGDFDRVFCFGGRSVSIWKVSPDGSIEQTWDSGDEIERVISQQMPKAFNMDSMTSPSRDARSVSKGSEPETPIVATINGVQILFCVLERAGGIMSWNISDPSHPKFLAYVNPRDPTVDLDIDTDKDGKPDHFLEAGDIAPEGILYIAPEQSPSGKPLLVVCNEGSGNVTLYEIELTPAQ